jgi:hypothetical protein
MHVYVCKNVYNVYSSNYAHALVPSSLFSSQVVVTNTEATAVGITVGIYVDAPPETDIKTTAVDVNANQRLDVSNDRGFSTDFIDTVFSVGTCDM